MKLIPETTSRRLLLCACVLTIGYTGYETYQKDLSWKVRMSHRSNIVQPLPTLVTDEKTVTPEPFSQHEADDRSGP